MKKSQILFMFASVLVFFVLYAVVPIPYIMYVKEHPKFTTDPVSGILFSSYEEEYFEVLDASSTRGVSSASASGYLVRVKEKGEEYLVSYLPEYSEASGFVSWHAGGIKFFGYILILICICVPVLILHVVFYISRERSC